MTDYEKLNERLQYLLSCVEVHANKFPVPTHMLAHVEECRKIPEAITTLQAERDEARKRVDIVESKLLDADVRVAERERCAGIAKKAVRKELSSYHGGWNDSAEQIHDAILNPETDG